jgi:hypothetical protein
MAMNTARKIASIIAAAAIALPQPALGRALSKAWNGTWQLNTAKSKFSSPDYTPKSDRRTYMVAGNRLTMRSTGINADGKTMKWGYSARIDGRSYPVSGNPNTDHIKLIYVSPREFKSNTMLKGKASAKSTVTLAADAKTLTIARSILTAKGGPTDDTMVFERTK